MTADPLAAFLDQRARARRRGARALPAGAARVPRARHRRDALQRVRRRQAPAADADAGRRRRRRAAPPTAAPRHADVGAAVDAALPAACAIELIHTYSLIHDDLPAMDNDTLRRGRPTLHVVYGDGIAILAGDGLQAEAFALLAREPATDDPGDRARASCASSGSSATPRAPAGMVGGQAIDLQAAGQAPGHALTLDADGLRAHARAQDRRADPRVGGQRRDHGRRRRRRSSRRSTRYAARRRPRVSDRRRHPRRRRRPASLGKTAGKDAAGGEADLSRALRPRTLARARRRVPASARTQALDERRPDRQAARRRSPTGSSRARTDSMHGCTVSIRVLCVESACAEQRRVSTSRSSSAASRRRASGRAR